MPGLCRASASWRPRLERVWQHRCTNLGTPTPNPSPQGGGERTESAAASESKNCGSDWECELRRLLGSVPAERALARVSRDTGATRRARDDCVIVRANPVAMEISAGGILGELPLPVWGKGWGEGVTDDRETLTPHPMGEGAHRVRCPSEQDGETECRNGRKTGRSPARGAGEQVPAGHQLANRQGARPRRASDATCARRRGDRMKRRPMTAVGTERTCQASPIMSA